MKRRFRAKDTHLYHDTEYCCKERAHENAVDDEDDRRESTDFLEASDTRVGPYDENSDFESIITDDRLVSGGESAEDHLTRGEQAAGECFECLGRNGTLSVSMSWQTLRDRSNKVGMCEDSPSESIRIDCQP